MAHQRWIWDFLLCNPKGNSVRKYIPYIKIIYFSLLAPKKSNKRKGTLQLVPTSRDTFAARFQSAGQQTRYAQTCRPLNPPEIAALGCVAMGLRKTVIE